MASSAVPIFATFEDDQIKKIEFKQMSAVQLDFPDAMFNWAVSTSMIEHLHPDDVDIHLSEVRRVLKAGGHYLMWCPNGLGHHDDRDVHLTMLSYSQWMEKLAKARFGRFRSTLTSRLPLVDARWKIFSTKFCCFHASILCGVTSESTCSWWQRNSTRRPAKHFERQRISKFIPDQVFVEETLSQSQNSALSF
jgi:SAM-dependent methyltransferase